VLLVVWWGGGGWVDVSAVGRVSVVLGWAWSGVPAAVVASGGGDASGAVGGGGGGRRCGGCRLRIGGVMARCAECGHDHFEGPEAGYSACPIEGCSCEGQVWAVVEALERELVAVRRELGRLEGLAQDARFERLALARRLLGLGVSVGRVAELAGVHRVSLHRLVRESGAGAARVVCVECGGVAGHASSCSRVLAGTSAEVRGG
jgi:hypothetical protein